MQSSGTGASAGDFLGVGSAALVTSGATGIATIATPNVPGGTYGVTARYSGDGKYYSSTSNSLNVTVTPEASQMQMGGLAGGYYIQTPLSVNYGEPVTLWVAVGGNSATDILQGKSVCWWTVHRRASLPETTKPRVP